MRTPALYVILVMMISGCGLKASVIGEYYLNRNNIPEGIEALETETRKHPCDAIALYYLGRLYLLNDQPDNGLNALRQAVELSPDKADFHFWLGMAYAACRQPDMERKSYLKALSIRKHHIQSLICLGHNQLENDEFHRALTTYSTVLDRWPECPDALFNRALILKRLGRTAEEQQSWKAYLALYPSGSFARTAVRHLNASGNFDYRNVIAGNRTIPIKSVRFRPSTTEIERDSRQGLDSIGEITVNDHLLQLHVVVYQKNNGALAEARAKSVKKYLFKKFPDISLHRIKVSWFSVPETITLNSGFWSLDESVHFIGIRKNRRI